ncbi:MAG: valine--tRNA ligase [Planctomycetes bacterium]|nr:valine--tRNA ligase [Planctomycetota bacterium]
MEFATRFSPKDVEPHVYKMWEAENLFAADAASRRDSYTIVIPPPNVTGSLHMGHALNNTLQDILIRWKRMDGFEALYLPGTDHAGIATQVVVEKDLRKTEGKTKEQLGREEFIKRVWGWKEKYGNTILYQLRRLGCSCDWSRSRFTMDEAYSRAIRTVFVSLFKKGLIYRGLYVVNWCPKDLTALSDLEVTRPEETPKGKLWYMKYPIKGEANTFITVATTRPETMLGDTAVAVHPKDARYLSIVGKTAVLPFVDREIPIVADEIVDPSFGTGAVKVTPAHDANDFEIARRHTLKAVTVMDPRGVMNENAAGFKGLDRFVARERVVEALREKGLLVKEEDYPTPVGRCYRCDTIVEPYLSDQWFVRMKTLAAPAEAAVRGGDLRGLPERWGKVTLDWMENIRDWCISRQIWWGHRVPVWYCPCGEAVAAVEDPRECPKCRGRALEQDGNVLDTWFSSALWPFATLGWPEETEDLEKFYPTRVLVTDRGIINLWVARMIMSGLEFRGEKPFSDVIIHATIMDDQGQRMSKSKGTGIDPLTLIDQYGADALRFALTWLSTGSQDFRFGATQSRRRTEEARNFLTKFWNAARFVATTAGDAAPTPPAEGLTLEDRWILSRLNSSIGTVTAALGKYEFSDAAQALYRFVWWDFCDWYIEHAKRRKDEAVKRVLAHVIDVTLRLLHPIAPFITEEIWQRLRASGPKRTGFLMKAEWPQEDPARRDPSLERRMELVFEVVRAMREVRTRYDIAPVEPLAAVVSAKDKETAGVLREGADTVKHLANLSNVEIGTDLDRPKRWASVHVEDAVVHADVVGKFDPAMERQRTEKRLGEVRGLVEQTQGQLANPKFRQAKPELAAQLEEKLAGLREQSSQLEEHLRELEG